MAKKNVNVADAELEEVEIAGEGEGIEGFNPAARNDAPMQPPKAGRYELQVDFSETEPEKRFVRGSKAEPSKNVLATTVTCTIVGCADLEYPEKKWGGRKIFRTRLGTEARDNGTTAFTDLLKAFGATPEELAPLGRRGWMEPAEELMTKYINTGRTVMAYCDWEWQGKTETITDSEGNPLYIRRDSRDEQLKNVPRGMKGATGSHPLTDADGNVIGEEADHSQPFVYVDEATDTEETVMLYAQLAINSFTPRKKTAATE